MSPKFNNMLVTGGTFNFAEGDINRSDESTVDKGIDRLFSNVAPGAFHDSGERFDPPKCHPNTRVAVIQEILDWLNDLESPELVMWLHGAAGAGKSAIAQTIAQMLFERGRLSGSFFFSRGSTTGRGDEKRLVPTLSYQLAKYLPETRVHIATAVVRDPAIFDLALHSQVQNLLVTPLSIASNVVSSSNTFPRLFIIDGLDECHDADVQCRILQAFSAAMKSMQHHLPQKLLMVSRSEIHLLAGFNERNTAAVCRRLALDNSYRPDDDIGLFLQDNFSKIKGEHHMRADLENSWPSEETIFSLVRKSSGQFIYASTVVKFVASARHHPAERLKIILGLKAAGRNDRPFAALDSLYGHIFQNVENIELVLCILRMELTGSFVAIPHGENRGGVYRNLMRITVGELELALGDLISVISVDREAGWFRFLHASIPDFLQDPYRSTTFYVDQPKVNLYRAECCVRAICEIYSNIPCAALYSAAWFHLSDCTGRLVDLANKELLYKLLSSLDMGRALDHLVLDLGRSPRDSFNLIGQVLLWSLQEYKTYPEQAASLLKLTHQFDIWFLPCLQSISINGSDSIDLMAFAMKQIDGDHTLLEHRLNILGLVENNSGTPTAVSNIRSVSDREEFLFPWYAWEYDKQHTSHFQLLHYFFHDLKRSGKYFMSGTRYANAALHCMNFLFDTRKSDTTNWIRSQWQLERESLYLAMEYATFFLGKATAAKALFERLLGGVTIPNSSSRISSAISAIEINARRQLNSQIDVVFSIDQRTFNKNAFVKMPLYPFFSRIFPLEEKSVAEWQEESVQIVVRAISEYVSMTCQSFFPQD